MAEKGFTLSEQAARRTAKTVRKVLGMPDQSGKGRTHRGQVFTKYECLLTADLAAAEKTVGTETTISGTTATANILYPEGSDLVESSEEITVTNRSPDFSASSGDYIIVMRHADEWRPLAAGGGGTCAKVVKIWYVGNELPTGGSVTVPMIYDGNSGSPSWAYNADQPTIESAIAGAISGLSSSDITVLFGQSATAGTAFGNWPITIEFPDVTLWAANGDITDTFTFASGTVPHVVLGDICCE